MGVSTLDRYIVVSVVRAVLLVAALLMGLFFLVLLVEELDAIGTGSYQWMDALKYVFLQAPRILLEFSSFIALIGTIIALGVLAGHQEIAAMQSLTMGPNRIFKPVMLAVLLIMVAVLFNAQWLLPQSLQTAHVQKQLATQQIGDVVTDSGYWTQHNGVFLRVGDVLRGRVPAQIEIYDYDKNYQLEQFIRAETAVVEVDNQWVLKNVELKEFRQIVPCYESRTTLVWDSFLTSSQLDIVLSPPEALSLSDLYQYVQDLKSNGEPAHQFELIFWERMLVPLATALMVLLGAQFIFGSTRSITMGKRMMVAILIGLFFYFLSKIVSHVGSIFRFEPALVASVPIFVMFLTLVTMRKLTKAS